MSTTQPSSVHDHDQQVDTPMAMATSSYGIIIPDLRHFIFVNAQPSDDLDEVIIINSPPSDHQTSTIHDYNDIQSMLFDGGPAYTTLRMEFTMNNYHGSVATARFLNDDDDEDHETAMTIARFVIQHQSLYGANNGISEVKILKRSLEIVGIGKEEEEEGEICVICQKEYEAYEMMGRLECKHGYHVECINKWLLHKNVCPICRAIVS